jgi:hypothetical protein
MATLTWTAGSSGLWVTASNWSPAQVPTVGDTVLVTQPGAYLISLPGSVEIANLTLSDPQAEINSGGTFKVDSSLVITAGTLATSLLATVNNLSNAGTLLNTGNLTLNGTVTAASLERICGPGSGGITVNGTIINTGGTLDGAPLVSQAFFNLGTVLGGTVVNWTPSVVAAGLDGVIWRGPLNIGFSGGTLTIADGLTLTGTNGTGAGTLITAGNPIPGEMVSLDFTNSQTFDSATFFGYGTIDAATTLIIGNGATFTRDSPASFEFDGGTIINNGTIVGHSSNFSQVVSLPNSGFISIGAADFENAGVISGTDASVPGTGVSGVEMQVSLTGSTFVNHAGGLIEVGQSLGIGLMTIAASTAFTNNGTLLTQAPSATSGGTIDIAAFLAGTGTIDLSGNGIVKIEGAAVSSQSLDFAGQGTLILNQPTFVASAINGFSLGDDIHLGNAATGVSYTNGDLRMQVVGGSTFDLAVTGTHILSDFIINTQTSSTDITLACFAAGTRLATVHGPVAVEALQAGDLMLLANSHDTTRAVWIGYREVDCVRHPEPHKVWPVRIAAGAFGQGVPRRDLYLSPDHAIFVRGVLIPVKYLVNGTTIVQIALDRVTYFHVELPRHDLLLAEGLSVESLLPSSDRVGFANSSGVLALHPAWAWEGEGCAPLMVTGPEVAAVRAMLARRASRPRRAA